jgi:glutathione S-transferase
MKKATSMPPTITAFANSPDKGRGLAPDMQVRWALEEAGQPYDVRLISFKEMKQPAHLALNPFGKIPTYEKGDLALFESGAIVLHIAETHKGLLPKDANARARAIAWMFSALSTVEPPLVNFTMAKLFDREKPWHEARLPEVEKSVRERMKELSARLGESDWLDGAFSAGDLMMIGVVRRLSSSKNPRRFSESQSLCRARRSEARFPARVRSAARGFQSRIGRRGDFFPKVNYE